MLISTTGSTSNVAVAHVRLGERAAFLGKVGDDDFGSDLVYRRNNGEGSDEGGLDRGGA